LINFFISVIFIWFAFTGMFKYAIVFACLFLVGCSPEGIDEPDESQVNFSFKPPVESLDEETVTWSADDVEFHLNRPEDWEIRTTEHGVILAEYIGSAADGYLTGLQVHVFVPSMDDVDTNVPDGINAAWSFLDHVVRDPEYVDDSAVSEPAGFEWGGYDAAYYLVDNRDGFVSMVIAVAVPDSHKLVACSVTAPHAQHDRIREYLPQLLDGLTINGVRLDSDALEALPDPLEYPQYRKS
jgi:hypothetical protein